MPGKDGTGPMGFGPMTGRAAGLCADIRMPGFVNSMPGRGFGFGFGGGQGFGSGYGKAWGRQNMFCRTAGTGWQRTAMGFSRFTKTQVSPYNTPKTPEQELDVLKARSEYFAHALEEIRKRMGELETTSK